MLTVAVLNVGILFGLTIFAMAFGIQGPPWVICGTKTTVSVDYTSSLQINSFGSRPAIVVVDIAFGTGPPKRWMLRQTKLGNPKPFNYTFYEGITVNDGIASNTDLGAFLVKEEHTDGQVSLVTVALLKINKEMCYVKDNEGSCSNLDFDHLFMDEMKLESLVHQLPTTGRHLDADPMLAEICVVWVNDFTNFFKTATNTHEAAAGDAEVFVSLSMILANKGISQLRHNGVAFDNVFIAEPAILVADHEAANPDWYNDYQNVYGEIELDNDEFITSYMTWVSSALKKTDCDHTVVISGKPLVTERDSGFTCTGRIYKSMFGYCNDPVSANTIVSGIAADFPVILLHVTTQALDSTDVTDQEGPWIQTMHNTDELPFVHDRVVINFGVISAPRIKKSIWGLEAAGKTCLLESNARVPPEVFTPEVCNRWTSTGYTMAAQCAAATRNSNPTAYPSQGFVEAVTRPECNRLFFCETTSGGFKAIPRAELSPCGTDGVCYKGVCCNKLTDGTPILGATQIPRKCLEITSA